MTEPRHLKVSERPTVRDVYMPHWAYLRTMAAQHLIAGDKPGSERLQKLARHVRNEWLEPGR